MKGDNADAINKIMKPRKLFLIDSWSNQPILDCEKEWSGKPWIKAGDDPKIIKYYGGSPRAGETFDKLFSMVQSRFADQINVEIIRQTSTEYYDAVSKNAPIEYFDFIYLDANHSYETVFQELMLFQNLLSEIGCIQLNDCCHSLKGIEQNLGVLEAVIKFLKISNFEPVFLTNSDWSDILLTKKSSKMFYELDKIVLDSNIDYVEIPHNILGSVRVIGGVKKRLSFL